eukprot:TRINITY_DN10745_c0_g1_i1.p1 TRINITY_DN10745_c0_g1~~TRINITY_DN10745_c0_g1_i1.p1  ORF type:complete len:400 (+),score=57.74 TRINITY_DN10745_c0_g1_i1:49-1248(+)
MSNFLKRFRLTPFANPVLCWRGYCSIPLVILILLTLCLIDIYYLNPSTKQSTHELDITTLRERVPLTLHRQRHNQDSIANLRCVTGKECLHIVIAATGVYLKPLLACMNSILQHTIRHVHFHLLVSEGESRILGDRFRHMFTNVPIEIVEFNSARVEPLIKIWKGGARHSNTLNHARLYLTELFPALDNVIYLDPDTIVVDDIGTLLDDFVSRKDQTNYFSAVVSKQLDLHSSTYDFLVNCNDVDVRQKVTSPSSKYFNAGVFVTDLRRWREDSITMELEKWLLLNTKRKLWNWGSQAPLTLVFYGRWDEMDSSWNERRMKFYDRQEFEKLAGHVRVYHFAGDDKPWKNNGKLLWHLWCKYYPIKTEFWFCQDGDYLNLMPSSPVDYGFVRQFWMRDGL